MYQRRYEEQPPSIPENYGGNTFERKETEENGESHDPKMTFEDAKDETGGSFAQAKILSPSEKPEKRHGEQDLLTALFAFMLLDSDLLEDLTPLLLLLLLWGAESEKR